MELLEQRGAGQDRRAAQDQRRDDPPEQQPRALPLGDPEVGEQQQEDDEVVERERALDQVDGGVVDRVLGRGEQPHRDRHEQRQDQPADARKRRLAEARLAPAREDLHVDEAEARG